MNFCNDSSLYCINNNSYFNDYLLIDDYAKNLW